MAPHRERTSAEQTDYLARAGPAETTADWFLLFPATTPAVIPGKLTSGHDQVMAGPFLASTSERLVKRQRLKRPLTAADYLAESGRWSVI